MKRFAEYTVLLGFVTACILAATPTRTSLSLNATTDCVVRLPSAFGITVGSPPSMTAMQEFVVPRSIPIILLIEKRKECQSESLGSARDELRRRLALAIVECQLAVVNRTP